MTNCFYARLQAHYPHGPRPALSGLWLDAQVAKAEAEKGAPLSAVEVKHIKYDPELAPPVTMSAINRPHYSGPVGATWP